VVRTRLPSALRRARPPRACSRASRHQFDRLHEDRSGDPREDPHESREGYSGVPVSGRMGGRAVISIQETASSRCFQQEELISKIMFMLNAPAQRVATVSVRGAAQSGGGDERSGEGNKFGGAGAATLRRLKQLNRTNFSSQEDRKRQWLAKWKRFSKK